jgi:hypothetical protein
MTRVNDFHKPALDKKNICIVDAKTIEASTKQILSDSPRWKAVSDHRLQLYVV